MNQSKVFRYAVLISALYHIIHAYIIPLTLIRSDNAYIDMSQESLLLTHMSDWTIQRSPIYFAFLKAVLSLCPQPTIAI